ncbi:uncharacterized protein LOC132904328 [Amyelois transitella]|uniref:uncharacterized protein LOC132904327 n=1 Tax=Amyelois transitella TaxID=680683 RepID=UPI00298FDD31|nr:uncharacterized protein LOC132904327 [Amyelois transitella]XP_060810238.1 uncharacterized protein LOC132904328 [Amyelois transitella]
MFIVISKTKKNFDIVSLRSDTTLSKPPVRVQQSIPVSNSDESMTTSTGPSGDNQNVTLRMKPTPAVEEFVLNDSRDESINSQDPMTDVKALAEELRAMRREISRMCDKIDKIDSFANTVNMRMDRMEARIDSLENKKTEFESCRIIALEETVSQLKLEIQDRDQEVLGNDIEIASFPEGKNENTTHLILTVAKKLGVELEERDVVKAQRVGPVPAPAEEGAVRRPRPLVVRLARRDTRDSLLRAARVRRGVTTEGMDLQAPGPSRKFYVNERLTKVNRRLFQKAREAAKRANFRFVWTREGKIYTRKEQGTASIRLRTDCDIVRVFEDCNVGSEYGNMQ